MPGFDKTGPEGKGKMTGRGVGSCNPDAPRGGGRGMGRGCGRGFGRRSAASSEKEEK
ncbi:DUF5320 domain-containing protein [Patescibacteria group bacterium]|nr:DUF5320 domain-containing protein [Patescibacteria group bacterium]